MTAADFPDEDISARKEDLVTSEISCCGVCGQNKQHVDS